MGINGWISVNLSKYKLLGGETGVNGLDLVKWASCANYKGGWIGGFC